MTICVSEPNALLDLTAGALRTVAEAIVTVLYVLAERRGGGVLGPRELDAVHLRSSPLPAVGCVRKENGGHVTLDIGTTHNAIDAAAAASQRPASLL